MAEEKTALAALVTLLNADDDAKWDAAFAESGDKLDRFADAAMADFRAGRTTPLDSEKL